ncbi:MAG: MFS transporter [Planctomycetota bacterium]|nr:MAG: MFS transporter [Planctomycetota bacterium]
MAGATRQRFWLIFLLFLHTVNTYLDRVCISAAKTDMQRDIAGLDDQMMGLVFGIFAVGYALFQIPAGWLSDRLGARRALTIVVVVWSIFTALTGAVFTAVSLLIVRFLFGVGEAGAYPGATRALYQWLPARERGIGQGIFHSGARIGAAMSLVIMPALIAWIGWRMMFVANGMVGIVWAAIWWFWFRDAPEDHRWTSDEEARMIAEGIREHRPVNASLPFIQIVTSKNVLLAMFQYAASNITFFISITWFHPYLKERWGEMSANLAALPLLVGAAALWLSGWTVTRLHHRGWPVASRRVPAMIGYALGATGLLLCTQVSHLDVAWPLVLCFSLAIFGVEMTLSPSWAFCMDIGGDRSGAVSGAMNMVGNLGSALSAVLFPYFVAHVTLPVLAESTGSANSFFVFAAAMNTMAIVAWLFMNPLQKLRPATRTALQLRMFVFAVLISLVAAGVIYTTFFKK